jgi:hypothetical protein
MRLDASLLEPVRWVFHSGDSVLALAGLCHGGTEDQKTVVYRALPIDGVWYLDPSAIFAGCPTTFVEEAGTLFAALAGSGVVKLTGRVASLAASFPAEARALRLQVTHSTDGEELLADFGTYAARVRGAHVTWYAPKACADQRVDVMGRCQCSGAAK